jgi:hypothetical protein
MAGIEKAVGLYYFLSIRKNSGYLSAEMKKLMQKLKVAKGLLVLNQAISVTIISKKPHHCSNFSHHHLQETTSLHI